MRKEMKKTQGLAIGTVIIFIMIMSVTGAAMLAVSITALRSAQVLPQLDAEYLSAEAVMNKAVTGVASGLVNNSGTGSPAEATTDAIGAEAFDILTNAPPLITTEFINTDPATALYTNEERYELIRNRLVADGFRGSVETLVTTFISNSLGGLPPNHVTNRNALIDGTAPMVGNPMFWLAGANSNLPQEGFGAPAFANLRREGTTPIVRLGWPTIGDFVDGIRVVGPVSGWTGSTPNQRRFEISIMPYITVNAYSGVNEFTERILLPFEPFYIQYEINPGSTSGDVGAFASVNENSFTCFGYCTESVTAIGCSSSCTHQHAFPPAHQPPPIGLGLSPLLSCYGNNPQSSCNGGQSSLHRITYNGGPPPSNVYIPEMETGNNAYRDWIIASAELNSVPFSAPNNSILRRKACGGDHIAVDGVTTYSCDGCISINGGAYQPVSLESIELTGTTQTLIGDWSNVNVIAGWGTSLILGTDTEPIIIQSSEINPSFIAVRTGTITVNVRHGFIMEWVYVASWWGGDTTFISHYDAIYGYGDVSMGAVFVSGAHMEGTVRAERLLNDMRPQFIAFQYLHMDLIVDNPIPTGNIGALFHATNNGANIRVNVSVDGHDFSGMVFASQSWNSSYINGHANFLVPPNPPTMPFMPSVQAWWDSLGLIVSSGGDELVVGSVSNPGFVGNGLDVSGVDRY